MGPHPSNWYSCKKEERLTQKGDSHVKPEQTLELGSQQLKNVWSFQKLQEARKDFPPLQSQLVHGLLTP